MLRIIKILMIFSVALWGLLGAFNNIVDWDGTTGAVAAVTSMSTWEGGGEAWRATDSALLVLLGSIAIPLLKSISAVLCIVGGWAMWQNWRGGPAAFDRAKRLALAGCGVAILLLFGGFIVIAETWFELWRSEALREGALQTAFRYLGCIGLIALFVAAPEADDRNA